MDDKLRLMRDVLAAKIDFQREEMDKAQKDYDQQPSAETHKQLVHHETVLHTLFGVMAQLRTIVTGSSAGEWPEEWANPINDDRAVVLATYPEAVAHVNDFTGQWAVYFALNAVVPLSRGATEADAWKRARERIGK